MWCLDVRVKKGTALTMEAVWSMPLRHLLTCASVLELGVDFDAKRMKNLRRGDSPHVSISDITNEGKNAGKNKQTDLRKQTSTDELSADNRTTNEETSERAKRPTDWRAQERSKGQLGEQTNERKIGQRETTNERASELTNRNNQQKIGLRTNQRMSERTNYNANAPTKK